MTMIYSNPARQEEEGALPNVEVWSDSVTIIRTHCGEFEVPGGSEDSRGFCPSCERATCVLPIDTFDAGESGIERTERVAWWWWSCFPGCLPDSDPVGPFATEQEAIGDAQFSAAAESDDYDGAQTIGTPTDLNDAE